MSTIISHYSFQLVEVCGSVDDMMLLLNPSRHESSPVARRSSSAMIFSFMLLNHMLGVTTWMDGVTFPYISKTAPAMASDIKRLVVCQL
jgi:hypothetical protein